MSSAKKTTKTADKRRQQSPAPKTTKRTKTKINSVLSTCPTDGAGWCPYPFSVAELKKRIQRLKKEQELAGVTAGH